MGPAGMEDERYKIPLFDGSNFSNWLFRVKVLLDVIDLNKFIENDLSDLEEKCSDNAEKEKLILSGKKCKAFIVQKIADSHLEYIKDKPTAKGITDCLKQTFERNSLASQLMLRKRLLLIKCDERDNIEAHFLMFDKLERE